VPPACYARQANKKQLEADAFEIRVRAEKRVGEMMEVQPRAGVGENKRFSENPLPTLSDAGIDKNLTNKARKLASLSEDDFEKLVSQRLQAEGWALTHGNRMTYLRKFTVEFG
jgi:hypothetical protein